MENFNAHGTHYGHTLCIQITAQVYTQPDRQSVGVHSVCCMTGHYAQGQVYLLVILLKIGTAICNAAGWLLFVFDISKGSEFNSK